MGEWNWVPYWISFSNWCRQRAAGSKFILSKIEIHCANTFLHFSTARRKYKNFWCIWCGKISFPSFFTACRCCRRCYFHCVLRLTSITRWSGYTKHFFLGFSSHISYPHPHKIHFRRTAAPCDAFFFLLLFFCSSSTTLKSRNFNFLLLLKLIIRIKKTREKSRVMWGDFTVAENVLVENITIHSVKPHSFSLGWHEAT